MHEFYKLTHPLRNASRIGKLLVGKQILNKSVFPSKKDSSVMIFEKYVPINVCLSLISA